MSDNKKPFVGYNHGKNKIQLEGNRFLHAKPIEIHLKEDGDINNEPSFAIVMEHVAFIHITFIVGEISLKMLNEGLEDIGYKIVPIQK